MIMLSGNYNFFNFLYLALCLSLADNSWLEVRRPFLTYSAPVITDIIMQSLYTDVTVLMNEWAESIFNDNVWWQDFEISIKVFICDMDWP